MKIYDLDDPAIAKLSDYQLIKEKRKNARPNEGQLNDQPFYINCTFSEFEEKYNTISLENAYAALGNPIKNQTTEKQCLKTVLS
jgi:hypothetical protein